MTGNIALDVAIGLIFVYLLYSLLATIIQEIIASCFSFRAKILEKAIFRMLEDEDQFPSFIQSFLHLFRKVNNNNDKKTVSGQFYNHPLIYFLGEGKYRKMPSYISSASFAKVVIDLLQGIEKEPGVSAAILIGQALKNKKLKFEGIPIPEKTLSYLTSLWNEAQGDVDKFRTSLENWFDETMERVTGWYKKYTQVVLFFLGLSIAILFNVDSIKIADKLAKDPKLREQIIQQADAYIKAHPNLSQELQKEKIENEKIFFPDSSGKASASDSLQIKKLDSISMANYVKAKQKRDELLKRSDSLINEDIQKANNALGIGYKHFGENYRKWYDFLYLVMGWLITSLAISLGAPFWFDLLNKLMKLRTSVTSGTPEESSTKTSSQKNKNQAVG